MTGDSVHHVLAIVPNWLGDVAMATPALRALHRRFPHAELSVSGPPAACALLNGIPWISHYLPVPPRARVVDLCRAATRMRPRARDIAVVFPHSFRAALLARLSGARRRIGQARDGRRYLLTDQVEPHREDGQIAPVYMATEYLDIVAALGCEDDRRGLELAASPRAIAEVREHLVGPGPLVGIAPGAAYGPSKRWAPERYAEVADRLRESSGAQCVLLAGPGEEDTRRAVQKAARQPLLECDEGHPTIDSLKATVSQLDLLIGNDSGPRHVAVAFHVPTVCIMGPTRPVYSSGPYERGGLLRVEVDCGPCQRPVCTEDHRCMTRITAERVVESALAYLPAARV